MNMAQRWIAIGLIIPLSSGCASMSDQQQTTAQGAGIGAGLGAGLGAIIGHQSGSGAEGALLGGLIGGAAGALYGNHVAGKKADFASEEDYLDACAAQAQKVHDEALQQSEALQTEIARLDTEVEALMAANEETKVDRDEARKLGKQVAAALAQAESSLDSVNDEIRIQRDVVTNEGESKAAVQLAALNDQIKALEAQKAELTEQTQRLADLNSRMSV